MKKENSLKKEYDLYVLSRDTVQLETVDTVALSVTKIKPITSPHREIALALHKELPRNKQEENVLRGVVRAEVKILDESKECCAIFNVVQMGIFKALEKIDIDEFYHRVDLQLVPQLISYIRSSVSILAAEAGLAPVVLPTMDILKSIRKNAKVDRKDGEK